jgi:folate-dependent phosphoribosylglycinamide formyltransferase PurN
MKIGLIVIDDGIYTHQWVRGFLGDRNHTICAGACLNPFSAHNFNPQNGRAKAILYRTRYYGLRATLKFGSRFLYGMMADALFRITGSGRAESVRSILSLADIPLVPIPDQDVNDSDFQVKLKAYEPDVLVCTFSQKAGENLRRLAPLGCLNIHFSCLPENAGREPVFWSLLRGQGYGLTVYRVGTVLDSGQMLIQKRLGMADLHSMDEAIQKVCTHVPAALSAALQRLEDGTGSQMPTPNLNSWPGPNDIQAFRGVGFRFI